MGLALLGMPAFTSGCGDSGNSSSSVVVPPTPPRASPARNKRSCERNPFQPPKGGRRPPNGSETLPSSESPDAVSEVVGLSVAGSG